MISNPGLCTWCQKKAVSVYMIIIKASALIITKAALKTSVLLIKLHTSESFSSAVTMRPPQPIFLYWTFNVTFYINLLLNCNKTTFWKWLIIEGCQLFWLSPRHFSTGHRVMKWFMRIIKYFLSGENILHWENIHGKLWAA